MSDGQIFVIGFIVGVLVGPAAYVEGYVEESIRLWWRRRHE